MSISDIARSVPFPFRVELIKASRRGRGGGSGGGGTLLPPDAGDTGLDTDFAPRGRSSGGAPEVRPAPLSGRPRVDSSEIGTRSYVGGSDDGSGSVRPVVRRPAAAPRPQGRGSVTGRPPVRSGASDDFEQRKSAMKELMADFVRYHANESLHPDVINPEGMYEDGADYSEPIEGQYGGTNVTFTATRNPQEAAAEILSRRQERADGIGAIQGRAAKPLTVDQRIQHELENNWMRDVYKHVSRHVRNNFDIEELTPEMLATHLRESYDDPESPISHDNLMGMFGHHPVLFHMGQSQKFRHIDDSVKDYAQYRHLYDEIYGPHGSIGGPTYDEMNRPLRAEIRANSRDFHARQRGIDTRRVAPDTRIWGEGPVDLEDGMGPPPLPNTRTAPSVGRQGAAPRRPDPATISTPSGANTSRNAAQAATDAFLRGALTEEQLANLLDRLGFQRSLSFAMKNADLIIKAFNGYDTGDPWNSASTQTSFADNMSQEQNYDQALWNIANNQIPALFQRFSDKFSDGIDNHESSSVKPDDTSSAAPAKPKRDKSSKGNQRAQPGGGLGSLGSPIPPTPPRVSSR